MVAEAQVVHFVMLLTSSFVVDLDQAVQRYVFRVVPFGEHTEVSIADVCIGILITGSFYLYFRTSYGGCCSLACKRFCGAVTG